MTEPEGSINARLGRHLAWVALTTGLSRADQFAHYAARHPFSNRKTKANAKWSIMKAAREETERLSPIALTHLFSDDAWRNQPSVTAAKLENITRCRHQYVPVNELVLNAYGSVASNVVNPLA